MRPESSIKGALGSARGGRWSSSCAVRVVIPSSDDRNSWSICGTYVGLWDGTRNDGAETCLNGGLRHTGNHTYLKSVNRSTSMGTSAVMRSLDRMAIVRLVIEVCIQM